MIHTPISHLGLTRRRSAARSILMVSTNSFRPKTIRGSRLAFLYTITQGYSIRTSPLPAKAPFCGATGHELLSDRASDSLKGALHWRAGSSTK